MRGGAGGWNAVGARFRKEKWKRERRSNGRGAREVGVPAKMRGVPLR